MSLLGEGMRRGPRLTTFLLEVAVLRVGYPANSAVGEDDRAHLVEELLQVGRRGVSSHVWRVWRSAAGQCKTV